MCTNVYMLYGSNLFLKLLQIINVVNPNNFLLDEVDHCYEHAKHNKYSC